MELENDGQQRLRLLGPLGGRAAARTKRLRRGIYLLPSMFTLANMFCGYACMVYALRGEFETAALFIGPAIILDMLDGRIARLTGTATAFGLEFDSLADIISFGIAPAILTFRWGLEPLGRLGWAAGFIFLTAGATRLARFNIQHSADKRYFVGMPIPAAAAVPAVTIYAFPEGPPTHAFAVLGLMLVLAFLMVSTIRYHSFKNLDLQARRPHQVLILIALVLAAITTHARPVLTALAYLYLVSGPIGWAWSRLKRRHTGTAPATEAGAGVEKPAAEPDGTAPEAFNLKP
jgi:CDP-diacylglycerol--serine O-phosphatidyltransferase